MASGALAPERPMSRGLLKNTILGLVLGLIIVVGGVVAWSISGSPQRCRPICAWSPILSKNRLTIEVMQKFERNGAQVKVMRWDQGDAAACRVG